MNNDWIVIVRNAVIIVCLWSGFIFVLWWTDKRKADKESKEYFERHNE